MRLGNLLRNIDALQIIGNVDSEVTGLTLDSREVKQGSLFAAIGGLQVDGHTFIEKAISQGAVCILCEKLPEKATGAVFVQVSSSSEALGIMAAEFYGNPSERLKVIGVTGTNGKTSVTTMLYEVYMSMGHKTGLLSTIKYSVNGVDYASTHTTPHSIRIQELLAEMLAAGCEYVFMEVSSHAIAQNRISGLKFEGGVFTNITHDHLDFHPTFKDYIYTKKRLFDHLPSSAFALYNRDDKNGPVMVQNTKAVKYTYSLKSISDFKTRILEHDFEGMLLEIRGDEMWVQLVGAFNAYNVLAVYAVCFLLGKDHHEIITALSAVKSVEGRFQSIKYKGISSVVDYAHTPDALQNVLETIDAIRTKNEQLICVIGCGGDRDREKRPIMAKIACQFATKVILTSDNPRSEDPQQIIEEMMVGVEAQHYKKVLKITDREEAIKTAVTLSSAGDVILVAGKGHEKYQEIKGVKQPFDDKEVLNRNLKLIHN